MPELINNAEAGPGPNSLPGACTHCQKENAGKTKSFCDAGAFSSTDVPSLFWPHTFNPCSSPVFFLLLEIHGNLIYLIILIYLQLSVFCHRCTIVFSLWLPMFSFGHSGFYNKSYSPPYASLFKGRKETWNYPKPKVCYLKDTRDWAWALPPFALNVKRATESRKQCSGLWTASNPSLYNSHFFPQTLIGLSSDWESFLIVHREN